MNRFMRGFAVGFGFAAIIAWWEMVFPEYFPGLLTSHHWKLVVAAMCLIAACIPPKKDAVRH